MSAMRWMTQFSVRALLVLTLAVAAFCSGWKAHEHWLKSRSLAPPKITLIEGQYIFECDPETGKLSRIDP